MRALKGTGAFTEEEDRLLAAYVESHGGKGLKGCINWGGVVEALKGKRNTMECQNRHHTLRRLNGKIEKDEKFNCLAKKEKNGKTDEGVDDRLGVDGREGSGDRGERGGGGGRGGEDVSSGVPSVIDDNESGQTHMQIEIEGDGEEEGGERIGERRNEGEEKRNTSNMPESEIKWLRDRERREGKIEEMTVIGRERGSGEDITRDASVAVASTESFVFHSYSHNENQLQLEVEEQRTRPNLESVQINRENKNINIDTQNTYQRNQNGMQIDNGMIMNLERNRRRKDEERERGNDDIVLENNGEKNSFSTFNVHNSPPLAAIEVEVEVDEGGERGRERGGVEKEGIEQHSIHSSSLSSLPISAQPPLPHSQFEPFASIPFLPYRSSCDRPDNTLPSTSSSSTSSSSASSSSRSLDCDILYIQESV